MLQNFFFENLSNLNKFFVVITSFTVDKEFLIILKVQNLRSSLKILKNHIGLQYNILSCVSGVDFYNQSFYRFCIVYDLLSVLYNNRIRIKVFATETTLIPSITNIFINANWWEREVWDFYGITFYNHPDLRRILSDYGFEGHPFKKDFPLTGYVEVRYDNNIKRILMEPLHLFQDFRLFEYQTAWQ